MPGTQETTPAVYAERLTWGVEALESGRYPKGTGALHRITTAPDGTVTHQWCCLGVFCKVAQDHGLPLPSHFPDLPYISRRQLEDFGGANEFLPALARDWFGFLTADPVLLRDDGSTRMRASHWNDVGQDGDGPEPDFTAIAAAFRRTYLGGTS